MTARSGRLRRRIDDGIIAPLATLVAAAGTRRFWPVLDEALSKLCPHDLCVVFRYSARRAPEHLYDDFTGILASTRFAEYRSRAYLLDPIYRLYRSGERAAAHRLRDIAPDRFFHSEYYRTYYHKTGIADEACLFHRVRGADLVIASLARIPGRKLFGRTEVATLAAWEPLLTALIKQHLLRSPAKGGPAVITPAASPATVKPHHHRLRQRAGEPLTQREIEIADHILRGHSSLSTAIQCGISVETVRVHRRHLYRKLSISSQAELFAVAVGTAAAATR